MANNCASHGRTILDIVNTAYSKGKLLFSVIGFFVCSLMHVNQRKFSNSFEFRWFSWKSQEHSFIWKNTKMQKSTSGRRNVLIDLNGIRSKFYLNDRFSQNKNGLSDWYRWKNWMIKDLFLNVLSSVTFEILLIELCSQAPLLIFAIYPLMLYHPLLFYIYQMTNKKSIFREVFFSISSISHIFVLHPFCTWLRSNKEIQK